MIQESQSQIITTALDFFCKGNVIAARVWLTRRMIVDNNNRGCHKTTGIVQDFPRFCNRALDTPNENRLLLDKAVLGIQLEGNQMLVALIS